MTKINQLNHSGGVTSKPVQTHVPFDRYLEEFSTTVHRVFTEAEPADRSLLQRGIPKGVLTSVMDLNPLVVCIPEEYGGRGGRISEILALLSAASYESLALSLTLGINSGLFIQPVVKYAREEVRGPILERFMKHRSMGGLMITEPDFGSDALNMQTRFSEKDTHYHIRGMKHWAGLTGSANYWLLTARGESAGGELRRDIDFFICDVAQPGQEIVVEELFDNLGLHQIPYGRNRIDVRVPLSHRLVPKTTGIKLLLDLLHRSRLHFPGMALGFIRRMMDEAFAHCMERNVGGQKLHGFDQVQQRLSRLQAAFTTASAMCAYSSQKAGVEHDLSGSGMVANAMKSFVTDLMQESAQSLVQLTGARAYRFSHIGGTGIIDSRPFQIFEGSNDMLYAQVGEGLVKRMKQAGEPNLARFMRHYRHTEHAAAEMADLLRFSLNMQMAQRKMVELGQIVSRVIAADMVMALGSRGFSHDLIASTLSELRHEIAGLLGSFVSRDEGRMIADCAGETSWFNLLD